MRVAADAIEAKTVERRQHGVGKQGDGGRFAAQRAAAPGNVEGGKQARTSFPFQEWERETQEWRRLEAFFIGLCHGSGKNLREACQEGEENRNGLSGRTGPVKR